MKNKNMTKRDLEKLYDDWEILDDDYLKTHKEFPRIWQARPNPKGKRLMIESH